MTSEGTNFSTLRRSTGTIPFCTGRGRVEQQSLCGFLSRIIVWEHGRGPMGGRQGLTEQEQAIFIFFPARPSLLQARLDAMGHCGELAIKTSGQANGKSRAGVLSWLVKTTSQTPAQAGAKRGLLQGVARVCAQQGLARRARPSQECEWLLIRRAAAHRRSAFREGEGEGVCVCVRACVRVCRGVCVCVRVCA